MLNCESKDIIQHLCEPLCQHIFTSRNHPISLSACFLTSTYFLNFITQEIRVGGSVCVCVCEGERGEREGCEGGGCFVKSNKEIKGKKKKK